MSSLSSSTVSARPGTACLGQRERLVASAAADVEHCRRRRRQVLKQLPVHHVGAHVALHRGVSLIGKLAGQLGPGVIAHGINVRDTADSGLPWAESLAALAGGDVPSVA